jgi:hypothetical protein
LAGQNPSARTATPRSIATTCRTPGTAFALSAFTRFTLPPKTGGRATSAISIPGTCTSRPKTALPLVLSGVSSRGVALPISLKSLGSFKATLRGGLRPAAFSASLP